MNLQTKTQDALYFAYHIISTYLDRWLWNMRGGWAYWHFNSIHGVLVRGMGGGGVSKWSVRKTDNNALHWDNTDHGKQMVRQQELPSKPPGASCY